MRPTACALLLPLVEQIRRGDRADAARSIRARGATRTARPRLGGAFLPIEDICELRMPFSPVYQKAKCPAGWSQIDFAEDVILNVDLTCACGAYPFVEGAEYIYHLSDGSRSHSAHALQRARAGYLQILELVDKRDWPPPVRELVRRVFKRGPGRRRASAGVARRRGHLARDRARRLGTVDYAADSPSRASRRRSQAIIGRVSSTIQVLPTTWPAR